jgi:ABC-type multidrug transport system fused ATPase/permease subunit
VLEAFAERTLIWGLNRSDWAANFDHVLVMHQGRVVEQGSYDELARDGRALHQQVAAA